MFMFYHCVPYQTKQLANKSKILYYEPTGSFRQNTTIHPHGQTILENGVTTVRTEQKGTIMHVVIHLRFLPGNRVSDTVPHEFPICSSLVKHTFEDRPYNEHFTACFIDFSSVQWIIGNVLCNLFSSFFFLAIKDTR